MKNDYEMYQSVLSKRNEHRVKKERQKRIILRTVPVLACLVLIIGLGLGYWNYSKNIPNIPSYPDINEKVATTRSEITTSVSTNSNSAATISSMKTVRTTTSHTTKKSTTTVTETSTSAEKNEITEVNTTKTEPPTQNTTFIKTTVTVTITTQSSVSKTVTTHDDSHITTSVITTSEKHKWSEDFPKVIINGVTYYYIGEDDGDNEFTTDEFLGLGTDFEGIFHEDPTIRYYTVLEDKNAVIAVTKKGDQIPFYKLQ